MCTEELRHRALRRPGKLSEKVHLQMRKCVWVREKDRIKLGRKKIEKEYVTENIKRDKENQIEGKLR